MKYTPRPLVGLLLVALATGCAAAPARVAEPPSPASAEAVAPVAPPAEASVAIARGGPWTDLMSAQQALAASAGSCPEACRALGSMDRAAGLLCRMASSHEDARLCDDSKERLIASREQVRTACGSCPGGPTVDPKAPAPSPQQ